MLRQDEMIVRPKFILILPENKFSWLSNSLARYVAFYSPVSSYLEPSLRGTTPIWSTAAWYRHETSLVTRRRQHGTTSICSLKLQEVSDYEVTLIRFCDKTLQVHAQSPGRWRKMAKTIKKSRHRRRHNVTQTTFLALNDEMCRAFNYTITTTTRDYA